MKGIKVLKAINQARDDFECDTIAKCFKKCGLVDNNAENLAGERFGATVGELREIIVKLMPIMEKVLMTMATT